jgi:pyruvate kinase
MLRKTKIVCTLGPASDNLDTLRKLILQGMNVARLNFSHGSHAQHRTRIQNIRQLAQAEGKTIAILLDTKGPEIRIGALQAPSIRLETGHPFVLTTEEVFGDSHRVAVTYKGCPDDVSLGTKILIDDGLIGLTVERVEGTEIYCKVSHGGTLKSHKGVNIPGIRVNLPSITAQDVQDILFGIEQEVDFIAASFVRKPQDVMAIRQILDEHRAQIQVIAKIESREGIENVDAILEVSDGLMVARGDLGMEIPVEEVPLVQKEMIRKCNRSGKPVITATQMLDSMQRNPRPTRAEASDVANAILDGTDAIMLSGETAAGKYPVEAVNTMARIALRTEAAINYQALWRQSVREIETNITDSISQAVVYTAHRLRSTAIITPTQSGFTARMVSKYRPQSPIIAITPHEQVLRRLALVWGVYPLFGSHCGTTDAVFQTAISTALSNGYIKQGDLVMITAGVPIGQIGTTNLMKVYIVGGILAKGQGIGKQVVTGAVVLGKTAAELRQQMVDGGIIVTYRTDKEMMELMERAGAIITEEGGLTSHAAVVGVSLGIPVIIGVENAVNLLQSETIVTVDSLRGQIFAGRAHVI